MMGQIDTHGLRSDFIITDGLERTAIGGVNQHHDNGDTDARYHERIQHGLEGREISEQVGAVGQRAQLIPLEYRTDDLRKAQSRDSQIIALQTQYRQTDEVSEDRSHDTARNQGQGYRNMNTGMRA